MAQALSANCPQAVVTFWRDAGPSAWFKANPAFDERFREAFFDLHLQAARRELGQWLGDAHSALALLLLLDQYPRNAFRGTGHMYGTDPLAREYARQVLDFKLDEQVEPALRQFCYLPFCHSERAEDQNLSLACHHHLGGEPLRWAQHHADIIARFGRFPHRNALLGRETTTEEAQFLETDGFSG